ncbi:hypothetical protein PV325_009019 [Microctonus aethiopoides]|nr:hypothetical protein PV325_009019 [Microctonus aethiopoides]
MINDRNISTRKSGTTIDAVFSRSLDTIESRTYISYFSYHKPIVSTVAIAPATQNVQAIEAPSNALDSEVSRFLCLTALHYMFFHGFNSSKRRNGRSYDSLNGYGCIIGFLNGKVLDYETCNRKCLLCDFGHKKEVHDCRFYSQDSAKAMEPAVEASLSNNSEILKTSGL